MQPPAAAVDRHLLQSDVLEDCRQVLCTLIGMVQCLPMLNNGPGLGVSLASTTRMRVCRNASQGRNFGTFTSLDRRQCCDCQRGAMPLHILYIYHTCNLLW